MQYLFLRHNEIHSGDNVLFSFVKLPEYKIICHPGTQLLLQCCIEEQFNKK